MEPTDGAQVHTQFHRGKSMQKRNSGSGVQAAEWYGEQWC